MKVDGFTHMSMHFSCNRDKRKPHTLKQMQYPSLKDTIKYIVIQMPTPVMKIFTVNSSRVNMVLGHQR